MRESTGGTGDASDTAVALYDWLLTQPDRHPSTTEAARDVPVTGARATPDDGEGAVREHARAAPSGTMDLHAHDEATGRADGAEKRDTASHAPSIERVRPKDIFDISAQTTWAQEAYGMFRKTDRDIPAVAHSVRGTPRPDGSIGFTPGEIAAVKDHVVNQQHPIVDCETGEVQMRRFDADADIAEAWQRMASGEAWPQDITLLEHELAELHYLRENPGSTYSEAHQHANTHFRWEDAVPPREGLDLNDFERRFT